MTKVGVINYGMGNLTSVCNSCEYLGFETQVILKPSDLDTVSHIILPGVGAFSEGMSRLTASGMTDAIRQIYEKRSKPLLGICLGMQLLAKTGLEGGQTEGLGIIPGIVKRLPDEKQRIPHIGWNNIQIKKENLILLSNMNVDYYFVHSYFVDTEKTFILAECQYGIDFACAIQRECFFGVQFHPEKSHEYGLKMLKNFLSVSC